MRSPLHRLIDQPACLGCNAGAMRATDVYRGTHVLFECTNAACRVTKEFRLPRLKRKVIYLDTSTVSHVVHALARADESAPYYRLYVALRAAAYSNVIACVGSCLVRMEGELSKHGTGIARMSRELGDAQVQHELSVREAQIYRAYGRYVRGDPPACPRRPSKKDAFEEEVNRWPSMLSFRSYMPSNPEWVVERRAAKVAARDRVETIYRRYAAQDLEFADILTRELEGFAKVLETDPIFYRLAYSAQQNRGLSQDGAREYVRAFLMSDHVATLPVAIINAKLHAALAMLCRGATPRLPKGSDPYDIDHVATYAPYVDVLITDRFIAEIANQGNVQIADQFRVVIRSLGSTEVEQFISWLESLTARSFVAKVSSKVYDAISAGGCFQELAGFASRYVAEP